MFKNSLKSSGKITAFHASTLTVALVGYGVYLRNNPVFNDSGNSGSEWQATRNGSKKETPVNSTAPRNPGKGASYVPKERDEDAPLFEDHESAAWSSFSSNLRAATSSVSAVQWSSIGDKIAEHVVPEWAKILPGNLAKLQREIDMVPGSLSDEIWQEASDEGINPEVQWDATVRIGKDLCLEEKAFLSRRKHHTTRALARYLDISETEIDPEDVPTIAMCGSGGGLRALVAGTGSYLSTQEVGLFDCVTYTAGVSGSTWLQTLYHSSLGGQRHEKLVQHLKNRIGVHIAFPPPALNLLTTAPTNKFLLSGVIEKLKGDPTANFGLVDVYGILLAARLLVPKGDFAVDDSNLKLSNQRKYIEKGAHPLPIYAAVRHEIPVEVQEEESKKQSDYHQVPSPVIKEKAEQKAKQEAWFQWFEFTPYELWCEELEAGIPTWSVGRHFQGGRNVPLENGLSLPELRIPFLMGVWSSAFCATLLDYYKEVRPILKGLAGFGDLDNLMVEKNEDLVEVHPIQPASIPNYCLGLAESLPPTCPKSINSATHLQLMDAGMSNNLPIYPLLRPGRNIDILISFDASADIKTGNWLSVAEGYAKQRGIKGWPVGTGWPKADATQSATNAEFEAAQASTAQEAAIKVADARESQRKEHENDTALSNPNGNPTSDDLGYCTIWVGSTEERYNSIDPPKSTRLAPNADADWELLSPNAGIAVIYFPFVANPTKVPDVDPNTSDYMSTWNFVYTPEEIDKVVSLARANFEEGSEQTRRCVRAVYERKKAGRIRREEQENQNRWWRRNKDSNDHFDA
ncbi:hypothetical protein MMC09_003560 [Bachmanniomyces sp. S44760]|nr:hypothetical protein [Bachmanniomyces sp. S44760]